MNDNRTEAACIPCSKDHMITVSALLGEAARMAKNRPIGDPEIQNRINAVEEELDVWERFDVSPSQISMLSDEEKSIVRDTINRARSGIRHKLESTGLRWGTGTVNDLEDIAHTASDISLDFKNRITPFYVRRIEKMITDRGFGEPRTEEERKERHMALYGTDVLPARGTGLTKTGQTSGDDTWKWVIGGVVAIGFLGFLGWLISKQKEG